MLKLKYKNNKTKMNWKKNAEQRIIDMWDTIKI